MNNMKICLIHSLWGKFARGGAEQVLSVLISELQAQGNEVVLITTSPKCSEVISEESGLKVYYLKSTFYNLDTVAYWQRFFWHIVNIVNIRKYFIIKKIVAQEKPQLIWTHNILGLGFLIFTLFKKDIYRHFHTLHDIQLLHPSGLLIWKQEKIINSFVACVYQGIIKWYISTETTIISPSQWLLEFHHRKGFFNNNQVRSVPNPVKTETENSNLSMTKKVSYNLTFLYVGQIEKHKGVEILINAFSELVNNQLRLVIVGEGSQLSGLQKNIADNRIIFLGRQSSAIVNDKMKSADCLVVPSLCYENYPTVILEAQATRLPVIGSNFGGIKEMINRQEFLFSPTKEGIKEKLTYFSKHPEELPQEVNHNNISSLMSAKNYVQHVLSN